MSAVERKAIKKSVSRLHKKYYGEDKDKIRIALTDRTNAILAAKGPSRNDLMLKVKAKGIKLFRVMNKAELAEVLTATPERVETLKKQAKDRWQAQWGKRGEKTRPVPLKTLNKGIVETVGSQKEAI